MKMNLLLKSVLKNQSCEQREHVTNIIDFPNEGGDF